MKGRHRIVVQNNRLHYEFEIKRNITIIQGNSATGKTTLVNMIRQAENLGSSSGVDISCDVPCRILEGRNWKLILQTIKGSIIFIDEENAFITTEEFASEVKGSDNYFVLITRENLYNLPYSVEEIYGIHSSGKYQNTKKTYQQTYQIYSAKDFRSVTPQKIIVEDSNSGFDFFKNVAELYGIVCESAGGKSNLFELTRKMKEETACIIADGAAIGPEMDRLYKQMKNKKNLVLYLPESFEWIILNSGLLEGKELQNILREPENYIDSKEFFSWERYFTFLLVNMTEGSYMKYRKAKLNQIYFHKRNREMILKSIKGIIWG